MLGIYAHLFHDFIYIMFSFVAVFRGMIETTTKATGWAVLFNLLIMSIVLILVIIIITLVVGPTMTVSSYFLRTPAMALSSIEIWLISLEIRFVLAAELTMAALI